MSKLDTLFTNEEAKADFMERYFDMCKTPNLGPNDIDLFGWDSVADDISEVLGQGAHEIGNDVTVEIGWTHTKTGNTELVRVGELVATPLPDPSEVSDPEYNDETGFIGDYVGDYKIA